MALEIVYGDSRNRLAARRLGETLRQYVHTGTVYLAYPVITTADERVEVDALLVSQAHGLVAFLISDISPDDIDAWRPIIQAQDRLYSALESSLRRHQGLLHGRNLALVPETVTVFPDSVHPPANTSGGTYLDLASVGPFVANLGPITHEVLRSLEAAVQNVSTIKPAKRRANVTKTESRGAILKIIEREIANLDRWQKSAAIESPDGPQRIRGLAGSGKTVVLSLKAAYWHAQHDDWRIAVTFASRTLYQQADDLITRFTFEQTNDKPDYSKLKILHSWGSRAHPGLYSTLAAALNQPVRDLAYARGKYGQDNAFQGICSELLQYAKLQPQITPIFDAVLIDEAQDLPPEFFQLVYLFTKPPKRIVWGYDELQKLSESAMPTTDELFGIDRDGASLVSLDNPVDGPRRDIVLPICYRNTPWALVTAHALGTGIYRTPGGLIQHPDTPQLWSDIGYETRQGRLDLGQTVTIARRPDSSPEYFDTLLSPGDAVHVQHFASEVDQDKWVAGEISKNLLTDELDPDDILIVLPDTYRARSRGARLREELSRRNIASHIVGVTTTQDAIFTDGSVAIAHIHRAKGNEAPMVYVLDAQYADDGWNLISRRNTVFTAITRSRAWVRILGWGSRATPILAEAAKVAENGYQLKFKIPTATELKTLRHIHRDRSEEDVEVARKATEGLGVFLEAFHAGVLNLNDLPPDMRTQLAQSLQRQHEIDETEFNDE